MECLDAQFKGMERKGQNPVDKGELCEIFLKNFLDDIFSDQFKIFRGGKVINIDENESDQIDIVLLAKNTPKLFGNKGVYPIESVYGTFSITATLHHPKLLAILDEFKSIPKTNPKFHFISSNSKENTMDKWNKRFPYKCAFGFTGDINLNWERELNEMVAKDSNLKDSLPDLIVVNKKGMIRKVLDKPQEVIGGGTIDKDFYYTDFGLVDCAAAIATIINELYNLSTWQNRVTPKYWEYFNEDFRVQ